ncbi:MAG: DUF4868 domain-containing protein [Cellulosilyticaceae bacterium]
MSITKIKKVFENIGSCDAWSLQILQIKNSKRNGTSYCGREITLSPEGTLTKFLTEISDRYCSQEKGLEKKYENVIEYDGSTVDKTIYKLEASNELVSSEYTKLIEAIGNPDSEVDPLEFSAQAYVLKGVISISGEETPIKMISMQNPVTSLKHKFLRANGTFTEISDKVISLRTAIDVVIINETVYMLTHAGENLFNMERAYKAVCEKQIANITDSNVINDAEAFSKVASRGHNPRKFISFNEAHLKKLKNVSSRKKMSKKFNIPLDGDKFDMNQQDAAEKLVKLLCDRGMVDPFDDNPMEVASSKKWE